MGHVDVTLDGPILTDFRCVVAKHTQGRRGARIALGVTVVFLSTERITIQPALKQADDQDMWPKFFGKDRIRFDLESIPVTGGAICTIRTGQCNWALYVHKCTND